ncbi:MAG TPA: hypothetical protein VFR24_27490 [Candidatus Angelobacter sp.]|nr:hypothetical protein [Candidatus Angelobacter sp.]
MPTELVRNKQLRLQAKAKLVAAFLEIIKSDTTTQAEREVAIKAISILCKEKKYGHSH